MDEIREKIEAVVAKLRGDCNLMERFKENPIKALEDILGVDIPDDIAKKVVDGVKAKLAAGDMAYKADDIKDAIGGLFSKFKK